MFQSELFDSGLTLMYYGMGVVFVFLTLLFILTVLMSAVVRKYLPEPVKAEAGKKQDTLLMQEHVSVITAAIHSYRNKYSTN